MKIIRTTKKQRELFTKHLDKLEDYAQGNFEDGECYMCEASKAKTGQNYVGSQGCAVCPISSKYQDGMSCLSNRVLHLKNVRGRYMYNYDKATPESIRERADWMAEQITKFTDCKME